MSEAMMLTANSVVQETVEMLNQSYKEWLENSVKSVQETFNAIETLKANGVEGVPDADKWNLRYGFHIYVTEPSQWGKIHKSVGKLELSSKEPVVNSDNEKKKGKKKQLVKLYLRPTNPAFKSVYFITEKQLTKNDRCQVKTVINKSVQVVCSVK